MLFMIGMGLGDENDVTAKGDAAIRSSSLVVLEMYTSILGVNTERLVSQWGASQGVMGRKRLMCVCSSKLSARTAICSRLAPSRLDPLCGAL